MKKKVVSLNEVRDNIEGLRGKMLQIKVNKGRKRIIKYSGEIEEVLPSLFTMTIVGEKNVSRLSCSYSDVICGDVVLTEKK